MKLFRSQRGDTILEVLIAVSILSLILIISFSLANRSNQGVRQAQERGEASRHTESQIELLKRYLSNTQNPVLPAEGSKFCMKADGTPSTAITGTIVPASALDTENFAAFQDAALADCKKGEFYYSYVERGQAGQVPDENTFTAHTRWYKVSGRGVDESTIVHKIYPDLAAREGGGTTPLNCGAGAYYVPDFGCVFAPQIRVSVFKVPPGVGQTTPSCSQTGVATGTATSVSGPGLATALTGVSTSVFNVPQFNATYTASYTPSPGFQDCYGTTQTPVTPAMGTAPPANVRQVNFYERPVCGPVLRYTAPYPHYSAAYAHYTAPYDHYQTIYWWGHVGPDGRRAGWPKATFQVWEGSALIEYRYRADLYNGGGNSPYHERWQLMSAPQYIGTYGDYLGTYADYLGTYGDPYYEQDCPD